jgi:hypothetical protein
VVVRGLLLLLLLLKLKLKLLLLVACQGADVRVRHWLKFARAKKGRSRASSRASVSLLLPILWRNDRNPVINTTVASLSSSFEVEKLFEVSQVCVGETKRRRRSAA